jgi:hypothetical protein
LSSLILIGIVYYKNKPNYLFRDKHHINMAKFHKINAGTFQKVYIPTILYFLNQVPALPCWLATRYTDKTFWDIAPGTDKRQGKGMGVGFRHHIIQERVSFWDTLR